MSRYIHSQQATNKAFKNLDFSDVGTMQEIIISQENYNLKRSQTSETASFWGFSLPLNLGEMSRNVVKLIRFATKISKNIGKR